MIILLILACALISAGCQEIRTLGYDLMLLESSDVVAVEIVNANKYPGVVFGVVLDLDPGTGNVISADVVKADTLGAFAFLVDKDRQHYVAAFADLDHNETYEAGEPAWFHADINGNPAPIVATDADGKFRTAGTLSPETRVPDGLLFAARSFRNRRPLEEIIDHQGIRVALGEIANLDDPKFSQIRGQVGLWEPASFPVLSGIGIYFLETYSAEKIPVLFVYGMSGSPQDWRYFFSHIDRDRYQPWFFYYPTGRRLDEMGEALNQGIERLQEHYGFRKLHVVAHSMGGLVARSFITKSVLRDGNDYIGEFITISTPWGGHDAAGMGARHSPMVVPSWYDLDPGSEFQRTLYEQSLRDRVPHTLIYGYRASDSVLLHKENDGSVTVASQLLPEVATAAIKVQGFDDTHVGILANREVFQVVSEVLDR